MSPRARLLVVISVVSTVVVAVHWPALSSQAFNIDDHEYFHNNPLVQNPGAASAWRVVSEVWHPSTVEGYYHPMALLSLMLDSALGATTQNLTIVHADSLILHTLTTALLVILVYQLLGNLWIAAMIGLLFGVHPLTVEPVVWLGQRKAVLAGLFTALCLVCHVAWVQRGSRRWYVLGLVALVLALLSKPTAVPIPALMLVLDFWPLRRLGWRAVLEKIPHGLIAAAALAVSIISHIPTVGIHTPAETGLLQTVLVACTKVIFVLGKIIWPASLSSFYARPNPVNLNNLYVDFCALATAALLLGTIVSMRFTRAVAGSMGLFLLALAPVLGFIGYSEIYVFDNYAYIPMFGVALLAAEVLRRAWGSEEAPPRRRFATAGAVTVVVAAFAAASWRYYFNAWRDTDQLYGYMINLVPGSPLLHMNIGYHYADTGRQSEALEQFLIAVQLNPVYGDGLYNLGAHYARLNRPQEAAEQFRTLVRLEPGRVAARMQLARIAAQLGRQDEAEDQYRAVLQMQPDHAEALNELGAEFNRTGRPTDAVPLLQRAVQKEPDWAPARGNLAVALAMIGRLDEARSQAQEAVRLQPTNGRRHLTLGRILAARGQLDDAAAALTRAIELDGNDLEALHQFALIRLQQGRADDAIALLRRALDLNGQFAPAHVLLGEAHRSQGDLAAAIEEYRQAVQADPSSADAHYAMGMTLGELGRSDESIRELQEALRLNPQHAGARKALGPGP